MNIEIARQFLETLFSEHLKKYNGFIEILHGDKFNLEEYYTNIDDIITGLNSFGNNICFGICPRAKQEML